jgi:regulator of cell morphogenesis and NO signaling
MRFGLREGARYTSGRGGPRADPLHASNIFRTHLQRLQESVSRPASCFGTVRNPVSMMMHEHDDAGSALRIMRGLSHGYSAPADACISFRTLYQALAEFEEDLHQHIHLENNILFPRAVEQETSL